MIGYEHPDHFCDRRRLYFRRTLVAGHGTAPRSGLVGQSRPDQFDPAWHHRARGADMESMGKWSFSFSSERPLRELDFGTHSLSFFHVCLLLVASLPPRIAISLANTAPDPSFRPPLGDCDQLLQTSGRNLDQFHS